jgi:F420-non-reducing hydrogenase small subunit
MADKKPKVAFYWCAGCGGCEEAVVDLGEQILDVVKLVDIVLWPVALDFKRKDVEALADGEIAAAFVNGAIRTTEQAEMAHLLRRKSQVVVAFGACAQMGGVPALANLWDRESILRTVYQESPSVVNEGKVEPQVEYRENGRVVTLPGFLDTVRTLGQVIEVDYTVPGCPPTPKLLLGAVQALLSGTLPSKGTVLAPDQALCEDCPRRETRPDKLLLKEFKRPHELVADQEKCLLAQGLLCLGPATRAGCESRCIQGNMPCTGCFGPTSRVRDYGAKALSAMASLADANDEAEIGVILSKIADPMGTMYRYSLASSPLRRRRKEARA